MDEQRISPEVAEWAKFIGLPADEALAIWNDTIVENMVRRWVDEHREFIMGFLAGSLARDGRLP